MEISYSFVADWGFYRTALARYRRQRPERLRNRLVGAVFIAGLILASVYGWSISASWAAIPQSALIGGIVAGASVYILQRILTPRRIRRSPGFGDTVNVVLDESGFRATAPNEQSVLSWAAFTRVARFPDGIALVRGNVIRWLPDSALQSATPAEAVAFVRSKIEVVDVG